MFRSSPLGSRLARFLRWSGGEVLISLLIAAAHRIDLPFWSRVKHGSRHRRSRLRHFLHRIAIRTPSFLQSRRTPIHPFIPFRLLANLVSASSRHHRIITHRHTLPAFDLPSYVSSLVRYSTRVPCMTIINQSNNPRDRPSIARCVLLAVVAPSLGGARTDGVDGMDGCWVLARFVDWRIE